MSTGQTCHPRRTKGEARATVALPMVLYENVRQASRGGLGGKRLGVGNAEFGGYAVVGEEERQCVAYTYVPKTADVLIS